MKVCGVELTGSEVNVCLLSYDNDVFHLPDCRVRKITYSKQDDAEKIRDFQFTFAKLMEDYKISHVAIKERQMKGKFAGSAIGFKLEAAIQLIKTLEVTVISPTLLKETIKRNPIPVMFEETGLKVFQKPAFETAYAYVMHKKFSE